MFVSPFMVVCVCCIVFLIITAVPPNLCVGPGFQYELYPAMWNLAFCGSLASEISAMSIFWSFRS